MAGLIAFRTAIAPGNGQIVDAVLVIVGGGQADHVGHDIRTVLVQLIGPGDLPGAFAGIRCHIHGIMPRVEVTVARLILELPDLDTGITGLTDVDRDLINGVAVKVAGGQLDVVLGGVSGLEFSDIFVSGSLVCIFLGRCIVFVAQIDRSGIMGVPLLHSSCHRCIIFRRKFVGAIEYIDSFIGGIGGCVGVDDAKIEVDKRAFAAVDGRTIFIIGCC